MVLVLTIRSKGSFQFVCQDSGSKLETKGQQKDENMFCVTHENHRPSAYAFAESLNPSLASLENSSKVTTDPLGGAGFSMPRVPIATKGSVIRQSPITEIRMRVKTCLVCTGPR